MLVVEIECRGLQAPSSSISLHPIKEVEVELLVVRTIRMERLGVIDPSLQPFARLGDILYAASDASDHGVIDDLEGVIAETVFGSTAPCPVMLPAGGSIKAVTAWTRVSGSSTGVMAIGSGARLLYDLERRRFKASGGEVPQRQPNQVHSQQQLSPQLEV